ncbi:MAG: hypothetical protein K2P80_02530 [Beijerinckiaceae bacterium]|nr:hypothetical protein [Beijerinckiaceae bacterium]
MPFFIVFVFVYSLCNVGFVSANAAPKSAVARNLADKDYCDKYGPPAGLFGPIVSVDDKGIAAKNSFTKKKCELTTSPTEIADEQIVVDFMKDRTIRTFSNLGMQIEYTSTDGKAYLWFPGNLQIARGSWRTKTATQRIIYDDPAIGRTWSEQPLVFLCYTYTNTSGGSRNREECHQYAYTKFTGRENRRGDIFKLATRDAVPFVLPKENVTLDALLKRAK